MMRRLWPLDPAAYTRHGLHGADRAWPESNCYVDLWVELLHAHGVEPAAALPFVFSLDCEGDQWTFAKFPLADLYSLYGVEVFELNVWRPVIVHIEEQLALDRPSIVEVDAFHLPDTAGTSYHASHVKTSIAVQALNRGARRLGYFHNAGYHELDGPDFAGLFGLDASGHECLPPYVEAVKLRARAPYQGSALVFASLDLLRGHMDRRPRDNPFRRWAPRLAADLESLSAGSLADFHPYAFATFRQFGAAFELGAAYLRWLQDNGEDGLEEEAAACDVIAATAKVLQLKTARLVSARRAFDPGPLLDTMATAWDVAIMGLTARYAALALHG